jgi:integrase
MKVKLTKATVEALAAPATGQIVVWDSEVPGFGLRIGAYTRTFILQRRIGSRLVKRTLGRFGEVTPEQARKDARAMAADLSRGIDPVAERKRAEARKVTLAQATTAYLADRQLKPRTVNDVETAMRRDFPDWQGMAITEIRPAMIEDRFKELTAGKASGAAGKLAMRYLRAILNHASAKFGDDDKPLLAANPVKRLSVTARGWTAGRRRRSTIKAQGVAAWFDAVLALDGFHLAAEARDCLLLMALTGVRPSEALGLLWDDVDLAGRTLTFRDTKNRTDHELPLTEWLADRLAARHGQSGGPLVFSDVIGTSLRYVHFRLALDRVAEQSGISIMPTDLRRTFITTAEALDTGPYTMKALLNHKPAGRDVTSGYVVITVDRLRAPMQAIEAALLGQAKLKPQAEVVALRAAQ